MADIPSHQRFQRMALIGGINRRLVDFAALVAALRGGVAQIDLYRVITPGTNNQPEERVVSPRLALPLNALNDLAGILVRMNQSVSSAQGAKKAKQA